MPELPEVETTRRGIGPHIIGKRLLRMEVREPRLRWPVAPELVEAIRNRVLRAVDRRGKYLIMRFDHGAALWHLGMSGSLRIVSTTRQPAKHDHIDWVFGKEAVLRFNDPRRFGALLWTEEKLEHHILLRHLGPEPLDEAFSADYLYRKSRGRKQAVKTFLMDARVVVGVGNIYANESLFLCGIHPGKPAGKLSGNDCRRLIEQIRMVLNQAIARGGTTLRDYVGGDGKPGYFAQELRVYGRGGQPCVSCAKPLTERPFANRTTVYCTICQRR